MRVVTSFMVGCLVLGGCGGDGSAPQQPVSQQPPPAAPAISALAPATATAGSGAFTLTVTGNNFVTNSAVEWNGGPLPTTFTSATRLAARVPATDIAASGTASITVANPATAGGISAAVAFTIAAAPPASTPAISALAPAAATAGGAAFTLTVTGTHFVSGSVVQWNGSGLNTSYASATKLSAQVPATDIAAGGTARITVANPATAGGTSAPVGFMIAAAPAAGPQVAQLNTFQTLSDANTGNASLQFNAATKAGDAIWVAVTVSDYAGVHTLAITDTEGNQYTLLDQENDGPPGTQTVAQFYAANIAGDSATPDTVNVTWTEDDYKGILIAEISGTTSSPLVGHAANIQDGLPAGSNNVTAGPIDVPQTATPALLVALSMNTSGGSSDTGGSGYGGPAVGTGMTQVSMLWDWGVNLATFATAAVPGTASVSSTFDAPDTDSYVTVTAVFH
jgi:hypothetical protein